jgi:hypothetical protein
VPPAALRNESVAALIVLAACGVRTGVGGGGAVAGAGGAGGAVDGGSAFVPRPADVVWPGAGCGQPLPPNQQPAIWGAPNGYTQFSAMGTGANLTDTPIAAMAVARSFWVRVPPDYDPSHPYRVVYLGMGCGMGQNANLNTYRLFNEPKGGTEEAIYVALDTPPDMATPNCYDTVGGLRSQEWEAFQLIQEFVDAHYCTDLNRIYVVGSGSGGSLANMWGCYFAGWPSKPRKFAPTYHIRGQVAYGGGEPPEQPACGYPVAALWVHNVDGDSPISGNLAALARVGRMNGCDTNYDDMEVQAPWHADDARIGNVCRWFFICPAATPVVFCTTNGIGLPNDDTRVIPAVTYFFDQVESGDRPPDADAGGTASDASGSPETHPRCMPACEYGTARCAPGGLSTCGLDATGCPAFGPAVPCPPNSECCSTCGQTSICLPDTNCPVVPAGCVGPGTFCLDPRTVATCATTKPDASTIFPCTYIASQTTCSLGQTCDGSVPLKAVCR